MIHRYWTGDEEPPCEPWLGQTVASWHPHTEVKDWTDDTLDPLLLALLDECAGQVRPDDLPRHRSNIVRLWLLHAHGGLWLDHDIIPIARLDSELLPWTLGGPSCHREGFVMFFPEPGHPELLNLLTAVALLPDSNDSAPSVSGSGLLSTLPCDFGKKPLHGMVAFGPRGERWSTTPKVIHLWDTRRSASVS